MPSSCLEGLEGFYIKGWRRILKPVILLLTQKVLKNLLNLYNSTHIYQLLSRYHNIAKAGN